MSQALTIASVHLIQLQAFQRKFEQTTFQPNELSQASKAFNELVKTAKENGNFELDTYTQLLADTRVLHDNITNQVNTNLQALENEKVKALQALTDLENTYKTELETKKDSVLVEIEAKRTALQADIKKVDEDLKAFQNLKTELTQLTQDFKSLSTEKEASINTLVTTKIQDFKNLSTEKEAHFNTLVTNAIKNIEEKESALLSVLETSSKEINKKLEEMTTKYNKFASYFLEQKTLKAFNALEHSNKNLLIALNTKAHQDFKQEILAKLNKG